MLLVLSQNISLKGIHNQTAYFPALLKLSLVKFEPELKLQKFWMFILNFWKRPYSLFEGLVVEQKLSNPQRDFILLNLEFNELL
jgi:hypothetical protein